MSLIFKRKLYRRLLEWKRVRDGKTAILIEGARRVGKSTLVERFAEKSRCIADFEDRPPQTFRAVGLRTVRSSVSGARSAMFTVHEFALSAFFLKSLRNSARSSSLSGLVLPIFGSRTSIIERMSECGV